MATDQSLTPERERYIRDYCTPGGPATRNIAEDFCLELLAELAALRAERQRLIDLWPAMVEALTNDTLAASVAELDDTRGDYGCCECEDCGRLRIAVLRKIALALPAPPKDGQ